MRSVDRVGGMVVLRALAVGRQRKPLPENPHRIGVIIPTAIGDTVLSSGVMSALAERYDRAQFFIYHGVNNASAVKLLPGQAIPILCSFTNPFASLRLLRAARLDMIVDLTPWTRITAIYARLGAPVAIGFNPVGQHRAMAFDIAVPHRGDLHERQNHAAVAALFSDRPYKIAISTEHFDVPQGLVLGRLVLCHASAGGTRAADKAWPTDNWVALTRRLTEAGWQVGFTGAPADVPLIEKILTAAALPPTKALSLCGQVPLAQLGDLMLRSRLLITIDTGVLHVAAAAGANILALHGPTRSSRWGAQTQNATSLDSCHPAAGYIRYGYEAHPRGHEIMPAHRVGDVAAAALAKLGQSNLTFDRQPIFTPDV